jgi:hypothetical protein
VTVPVHSAAADSRRSSPGGARRPRPVAPATLRRRSPQQHSFTDTGRKRHSTRRNYLAAPRLLNEPTNLGLPGFPNVSSMPFASQCPESVQNITPDYHDLNGPSGQFRLVPGFDVAFYPSLGQPRPTPVFFLLTMPRLRSSLLSTTTHSSCPRTRLNQVPNLLPNGNLCRGKSETNNKQGSRTNGAWPVCHRPMLPITLTSLANVDCCPRTS